MSRVSGFQPIAQVQPPHLAQQRRQPRRLMLQNGAAQHRRGRARIAQCAGLVQVLRLPPEADSALGGSAPTSKPPAPARRCGNRRHAASAPGPGADAASCWFRPTHRGCRVALRPGSATPRAAGPAGLPCSLPPAWRRRAAAGRRFPPPAAGRRDCSAPPTAARPPERRCGRSRSAPRSASRPTGSACPGTAHAPPIARPTASAAPAPSRHRAAEPARAPSAPR